MSDSSALESFLGKWRSRWPEWAVAEAFVPVERRALAVAWFALLQEFEDVMNVAGDPLPADAKLAWWGQELRDWSGRRSRHPLGRTLEPHAAPWSSLADALPLLIEARAQAGSGEAAFAQLAPFGQAVADVEAVLLGGPALDPQRVVADMLSARLMEGGGGDVAQADTGWIACKQRVRAHGTMGGRPAGPWCHGTFRRTGAADLFGLVPPAFATSRNRTGSGIAGTHPVYGLASCTGWMSDAGRFPSMVLNGRHRHHLSL